MGSLNKIYLTIWNQIVVHQQGQVFVQSRQSRLMLSPKEINCVYRKLCLNCAETVARNIDVNEVYTPVNSSLQHLPIVESVDEIVEPHIGLSNSCQPRMISPCTKAVSRMEGCRTRSLQ